VQKNLLRKTLSLFVALAVVFSLQLAPATAASAGGVLGSYDGLIYGDLGNDKAVVIGADGSNPPSGLLTIPDKVTFNGSDFTVTEIGEGAFAMNMGITGAAIGSNVELIGEGAFAMCMQLASVTIPSSVKTIEGLAFVYTALSGEITIPNTVTDIGGGAFAAPRISFFAVTSGGTNTFTTSNELLLSFDGAELVACPASVTSVTIPASVTRLGNGAFMYCSALTSISIPANVVTIDEGAFSQCASLSDVTFEGDGIESIGEGAFSNCTQISDIALPQSITRIDATAFYNTGLTGVTIPAGVTHIGAGAFAAPGLTAFTVSGGTNFKVENDMLLSYDGTALLAYPNGKSGDIVLPASVSQIGPGAFLGNTTLTSYEIPNRITRIDERAFLACANLTDITIPNTVTVIGEGAFVSTALTDVLIPASVTKIEGSAFASCQSLSKLTFLRNMPPEFGVSDEGEGVFYAVMNPLTVTVPYGRQAIYETALADILPAGSTIVEAPSVGYGTGNSGYSGGGSSASVSQTAPAADGTVAVSYTQSGGTVTLSLSDAKANEIIAKADTAARIDLSKAANATAVVFPNAALSSFANAALAVEIKLPAGTVVLEAKTAKTMTEQASGNISVSLKPVAASELNVRQTEAVGNAPVYDISVLSDGRNITDFAGGLIGITLPYSLKAGEKAAGVSVWRLDADGKAQKMNAIYDERAGTVGFTTDHLSLYAILYDDEAAGATAPWANPFADVSESAWYYGDVEYAVTNGLFAGTDAASFSPNMPMTRGMLVTVLGRYHSVDASAYSESAFADVPADQYYAAYVAWAKQSGIVGGVGGGKFMPDNPVARQDLAVIIANYAEFSDSNFPVTLQYTMFGDSAEIADYAKNAVQTLYSAGIISGKPASSIVSGSEHQLSPQGDNLFDPKGEATRAEVAAVLHRFIKKAR
jgi:hypothetical protein